MDIEGLCIGKRQAQRGEGFAVLLLALQSLAVASQLRSTCKCEGERVCNTDSSGTDPIHDHSVPNYLSVRNMQYISVCFL
ncbi:hypothetical protein M430DRAFT_200808 [Amorphotheca resinae ATCC 22711]|jgi:hypothetical protein|uniref:Uncharacterized protein n=1 Tax=Amorphotheca resinae ATCC 22711 TaxID=857342 RepID=A0A2T3BAH4_AMORE|nr:hypothetical protein M430DRAFT_200808 [Amorphotheca resinae ATCC 22711]PSS25325.1 hypothetical protein M430DRAFT_200808 [Amorphotheca resinae ATCC 22711]